MLDVGAKRRLVGAVVLVVLAVVFLPMLVEEDGPQNPVPEEELRMPAPPPAERGRQAEIFPSIEETGPRPVSRPDPGAPRPEPAAELAPVAGAEPEPEPEPVAVSTAPAVLKPETQGKSPAAAAPKAESVKPKSAAEAVPQKAKPASPASPKPVPKGLTSWVVQVAALSTPEAAQRLEVDLRGKGFHAFVEKIEGPTRTLWRVRVGPEVERTRADALATDVKKRTGLDAVVRKYRDG
jgi:DedD protein